jgi:uncharacterized protein involved in response to NO
MVINLESPKKNVSNSQFAFLHLGFRPFFLGASSFAILAILVWMGIYALGWKMSFAHFAPMTWHAHEMIFGYSIAVMAGFLLTAIKNWTGRQTIHGYPLLGLFLVWIAARILPFFGEFVPLGIIALIDNLFIVLLSVAVFLPLIKAKQWMNVALVSILPLLLISNIVFYLGVAGELTKGISYGLYAGLYLIISLIFLMGRRVIPFFIEKGVNKDCPVHIKNWRWIDSSHLIILSLFVIADLNNPYSYFTAGLAGLLCLVHGIRLIGWHTPGIWKKPLLWILYLGYASIVVGFALKALVVVSDISIYLAVHAFAFGGIGLITMGMMARVALGHTGRNVFDPPRSLFWIFALLFSGTLIRVFFPLIDSSFYLVWITLSQLFWVMGFASFLYLYFPMLISPRIDGRMG